MFLITNTFHQPPNIYLCGSMYRRFFKKRLHFNCLKYLYGERVVHMCASVLEGLGHDIPLE